MNVKGSSSPRRLRVGWLSREQLRTELDRVGVLLNASAEVLLKSPAFDQQGLDFFHVALCTVGQLGFEGGASLSSIFAKAHDIGFSLCPAIAGPYLRLLMTDQESAPDSVMSNGSAPSGSIAVAAAPFRNDDDLPKGFYLRVIDGDLWLRGYHATDQHIWSPDDCFAFRVDG